MHCVSRLVLAALGFVTLAACTATSGNGSGSRGGDGADRPAVALASAEPGRFESSRPGTPIPLTTLRTMDDRQVASTFGRPVFQREESGVVRLLRFKSDACDLDLFLYSTGTGWQVRHVDARDHTLRNLPVDRCAGSVAAQKRTA